VISFGRAAAKINYLTYSAKESVTARLARRQERLRGRVHAASPRYAVWTSWFARTAAGAGAGMERRRSFPGGIERAGVTSAGRGGATCLIGMGDGSGARRFGTARPCVLRAGLAARARVTGALPLVLVCLARVTGDLPLGCLADTALRLVCFWFLTGDRRAGRCDARGAFFFLDFPAFKSFPLFCLIAPGLGQGTQDPFPG
jgi:hypothetical protein